MSLLMSQQIEHRWKTYNAPLPRSSADTLPVFSDRRLAVAQDAYHRLRLRIAVAIATLQTVEWQQAIARDGLRLPVRIFENRLFPAYEMSNEERASTAMDAAQRRQSARESIVIRLAPGVVDLLETYGKRQENPYLLAWDLMANFVEIFEPFHAALVRKLASAEDLRGSLPDLAFTMVQQRLDKPDWCSTAFLFASHSMQ